MAREESRDRRGGARLFYNQLSGNAHRSSERELIHYGKDSTKPFMRHLLPGPKNLPLGSASNNGDRVLTWGVMWPKIHIQTVAVAQPLFSLTVSVANKLGSLKRWELFLLGVIDVIHETKSKCWAEQAVCKGQGMKKQECGSQINFSTPEGWGDWNRGFLEWRGWTWKARGRILIAFLEMGGELLGAEALPSFCPFMASSHHCCGDCQPLWHWWECHWAWKWDCNEVGGSAKTST